MRFSVSMPASLRARMARLRLTISCSSALRCFQLFDFAAKLRDARLGGVIGFCRHGLDLLISRVALRICFRKLILKGGNLRLVPGDGFLKASDLRAFVRTALLDVQQLCLFLRVE